MCVRSLSSRPKLPLLHKPCRFLPNLVLVAREPVELNFLLLRLLLLHIFPDTTRGLGEIRIPRDHYLIERVGLDIKMPTRFSSEIVRNGDDGANRIFSTRDGVTSEDVRIGMKEGVATLTEEGQSKDAMVNMEFRGVGIDANGEVLKT